MKVKRVMETRMIDRCVDCHNASTLWKGTLNGLEETSYCYLTKQFNFPYCIARNCPLPDMKGEK
jgi:hypothetical protein